MTGATKVLSRKTRIPKWTSLLDAVRTIFEADPIGRWNREGTPVLYTALSRALACLETLVHPSGSTALPLNRYLVEITIPQAAWKARRTFNRAGPVNVGWDAEPAGLISIDWGTAWLDSKASLIAVVPSIIVPEEQNVLLNPRHPDARILRFSKQRKWTYDLRPS